MRLSSKYLHYFVFYFFLFYFWRDGFFELLMILVSFVYHFILIKSFSNVYFLLVNTLSIYQTWRKWWNLYLIQSYRECQCFSNLQYSWEDASSLNTICTSISYIISKLWKFYTVLLAVINRQNHKIHYYILQEVKQKLIRIPIDYTFSTVDSTFPFSVPSIKLKV